MAEVTDGDKDLIEDIYYVYAEDKLTGPYPDASIAADSLSSMEADSSEFLLLVLAVAGTAYKVKGKMN